MKLFWMGGPTWLDDPNIPQDADQLLAYVSAESDHEAIEKARLLGIVAHGGEYTRCAEVSFPERIPEAFVGRTLSQADLDELHRIRDAAGGETSSTLLPWLMREVAKIVDELDDIVVGYNRCLRAEGADPSPP